MHLIRIIIVLSLMSFSQAVVSAEIVIMGLFNGMVILTVDGEKRKLRNGQVSVEGVKLIESDSEKAILEINGKRETHSLGTHISSTYEKPLQSEAQIWPKDGMYLTSGSINGQTIDFLVDTGASFVVMNSSTARKLGIDYRYTGIKGMASTANGDVVTYNLKLKSVQVGNIKLKNIQGAVIEGNSPSQVLLGNSFLNRLEMSRKGRMMQLKTKY
jgi:aspartyl protease family protein